LKYVCIFLCFNASVSTKSILSSRLSSCFVLYHDTLHAVDQISKEAARVVFRPIIEAFFKKFFSDSFLSNSLFIFLLLMCIALNEVFFQLLFSFFSMN